MNRTIPVTDEILAKAQELLKQEQEQATTTNKPKNTFRAGLVRATVWENQHEKDGKPFTVNNINIERRYKDRFGNWKSTNSLTLNDIPRAIIVLTKAYESLVMFEEE